MFYSNSQPFCSYHEFFKKLLNHAWCWSLCVMSCVNSGHFWGHSRMAISEHIRVVCLSFGAIVESVEIIPLLIEHFSLLSRFDHEHRTKSSNRPRTVFLIILRGSPSGFFGLGFCWKLAQAVNRGPWFHFSLLKCSLTTKPVIFENVGFPVFRVFWVFYGRRTQIW